MLSAKDGTVEMESSRYPFCFYGAAKSPAATRSILPFVPFNQDLNRFTLVVKNLAAGRAKVTFGTATKTFSRADLEKGINLAAEFLDNLFSEPFAKVEQAVAAKENFETAWIKYLISNFRMVAPALADDAEATAAMNTLRQRCLAKEEQLEQRVRAQIVPVKYTIKVEPER